MNSENENSICDVLEIMESNRDCEANDIPTPLDDILKNVYELHSNAKDFNPEFNSTMSDSRLFNAGINSVANNFNLNFSNDASLYVSAQSNSATDSSIYVTPMLHHTADYQSTSSLQYPPQAESNDYMEYLVNQKMYNMATTSTTAIREEDNDPSPVYLNFNLENISQPALQTFHSELEKISNEMANREAENKNETLKYVEFINDIEETVQAKQVDANSEQNPIFRQLTANFIAPTTTSSKTSLPQIYDVSNDIDRINASNNMTEVAPAYQPLNNFTNITEFQRPNLNIRRNIISRKPLQTKLTIKLTNLEWAFINDKNNITENSNEDISSIENVVPDIPFIRDRPRIRARKQILRILSEPEMSFMNTMGEFSALSAEQNLTFPGKQPKHPVIDNSFVTFRKKMKPIETYTEPIEESPITTTTRNMSFNKSNRRTIAASSTPTRNSVNPTEILISSDTESEDEEDIQSNEIKCLKCNNCKKMFKTARSYSIHKKRCDAPGFAENPHVVYEVEYLESENEDDIDTILSSEKYEPRPKRTLALRKKSSIAESDSIESLDIPKNIQESVRNYANVTRRNTRSSQKNTTASSSSSTANNSPVRSRKSKSLIPSPVASKMSSSNILNCDICDKKFRQRSYLIAHKRIHEKLYKCDYCFKTFGIKAAYDTHIMNKCEKIPTVKLKKLQLAVGSSYSCR